MSVIYLGIVPTGVAWLLRFKILKKNGLIFQSQVSYLIPIFGIILGLSLIHISEPTRLRRISYAVFCLKKNENVTGSILIWTTLILFRLMCMLETPWENTPSLNSTMSVIYLGIVPTGVAWLLRFKILKKNGLIFQSQVSYLIPIFGIILGYIFLSELITYKVLISLLAVVVGIYFVRKADTKIII